MWVVNFGCAIHWKVFVLSPVSLNSSLHCTGHFLHFFFASWMFEHFAHAVHFPEETPCIYIWSARSRFCLHSWNPGEWKTHHENVTSPLMKLWVLWTKLQSRSRLNQCMIHLDFYIEHQKRSGVVLLTGICSWTEYFGFLILEFGILKKLSKFLLDVIFGSDTIPTISYRYAMGLPKNSLRIILPCIAEITTWFNPTSALTVWPSVLQETKILLSWALLMDDTCMSTVCIWSRTHTDTGNMYSNETWFHKDSTTKWQPNWCRRGTLISKLFFSKCWTCTGSRHTNSLQ